MAAAKIRVSDIAKRMGKSEKDVIFQLQSLGAEITDPSQALEPEVINALITGKKLSTRTKSVIMREDKPQVAAKKETVVRPPRPIIKPPVRAKKETPVEEVPAAPPTPSVIIPEFVQAAEAEERAALEAPAPDGSGWSAPRRCGHAGSGWWAGTPSPGPGSSGRSSSAGHPRHAADAAQEAC